MDTLLSRTHVLELVSDFLFCFTFTFDPSTHVFVWLGDPYNENIISVLISKFSFMKYILSNLIELQNQ